MCVPFIRGDRCSHASVHGGKKGLFLTTCALLLHFLVALQLLATVLTVMPVMYERFIADFQHDRSEYEIALAVVVYFKIYKVI